MHYRPCVPVLYPNSKYPKQFNYFLELLTTVIKLLNIIYEKLFAILSHIV